MIEKSVSIHDRFQFEIKLGYTIKKKQKKNSYNIDTYFFIPDSLGITPHTYSKKMFYEDIQNYIRLKTPTLLLRQLTDPQTSPIPGLKRSIDTLISQRDKRARRDFEYQVKMVCSIAKSALRDHADFAQKCPPSDLHILIDEYINQSEKLAAAYRDLKPIISVPTTTSKSLAIYRFGDEFISQNIELYGFRLLMLIEDSVSKTDRLGDLRNQLVRLIKSETDYRSSCGYHEAPGENKDPQNEALIYRRSVLKKYIGSVLFLDTHQEREGKFLEQMIIGIAAGLSMIFATLVAFFAQQKYGNFTLPLFMLLVISYIFKDRIKELSRGYFVKKFSKSRFDHKTGIYSDERQQIGICKEAVNFIDENELLPAIKHIRKKEHITEIENRWRGEKIILYRKHIHLFSKHLKCVYKEFNIEGVNDIIRFNINRFLAKMDNPSKKIYTLEGDHLRIINGNRTYHIILIIKISEEQKTIYKRIRLTLSRGGIEGIEEMDAD